MIQKDRNKIDDRSFYFSKIMPIKNKILIIINEEFFLIYYIKEKFNKSIYLSNACIREFPVSATKTFP